MGHCVRRVQAVPTDSDVRKSVDVPSDEKAPGAVMELGGEIYDAEI